jgi:hypothetical protein
MRRPSVTGELAYQLAQRQFGVPCLQALLHRARFGKVRIERYHGA